MMSTKVLRELSVPGDAVRGFAWVAAAKVSMHGSGVLRVVVLARLLAPHDFGLMGIALVMLSALEVFTEPGLNTALIQRRGVSQLDLDTVFTVGVLRGTAIALFLVILGPWCAAWVGSVESAPIVRSLAVLTVLRGLVNPATAHLTKRLDFRKIFYWNFFEAVAGLSAAVVFGLLYRNVWALVWATMLAQAARTAASYLLCTYKPRLKVDRHSLGALTSFGRWVWASNLAIFIGAQGDSALVGKILGASALGLYQVAFRVSSLPRITVTEIVSQVAYPLFCRIQTDRAYLKRIYLKLSVLTLAVNVVFTLLLLGFAERLVWFLLGPTWISASGVLRILAIASLLRSTSVIPGYLLYAAGLPQVNLQITAARAAVILATMYPLSQHYGLIGCGWSALAAAAAMLPPWLYAVPRVFKDAHGESTGDPRAHAVAALPETQHPNALKCTRARALTQAD